ncbi:serine/threonine protein phosphatase PrpC [Bradyrhizobium sp. USDA 4524]|uniref:DUF5681 domain-containing protein n=1 Tax=unclassified Bradyrhizobium TaxID=2631580 RepID=UPI00209DD3A3|nr:MULTISPECIES: DUF5681 domain-containing protein [unclassified Bradyrhizobium]MCP1837123.1 serine/threonine protein phosphatase PrpC [Bradyrhizobium sp. USDA 4538]MCP1906142.1 serine/threonine protein phosphatase PrpC [Bradyrhizobium sp. USDA 4537]MCP1988204.1 serine/threonine protein phosphatase PrpC [Bradyrhizobium sp. USDA 4539]
MPRNELGQFEKGTCGNPRGRPRKQPLEISSERQRREFFEATEKQIIVTENGKRKSVSVHTAIDLQLMRKAISGDLRAIIEYNKRYERYTSDHVKQQLENLEAIIDAENRIRKYPEDVTDELKQAVKLMRATLDPYWRRA